MRPALRSRLTAPAILPLGKLHQQGILTDEEFSQEKAKILGI